MTRKRRQRQTWYEGRKPPSLDAPSVDGSAVPDLHLVEEVPWVEPDRAELLEDVADWIAGYVLVTEAQLDVVTVYVAHTYAISAADCTPYLAVMSIGPRAGKTRLLEVLEQLVRRPLRTADITEAALFHLMSDPRYPRTLLLDEVDTVFGGGKSREPLRALLNAGYRRGTPVRRVKGGKVAEYDVFSAKVIAGIGTLPATVADRSIPVTMKRKPGKIQVRRYRQKVVESESAELRERLDTAFSASENTVDWLQEVANHAPELPEFLHDRAQDSWEPLLSLAERIGGGWDERLRSAALELMASGDDEETSWDHKVRGGGGK